MSASDQAPRVLVCGGRAFDRVALVTDTLRPLLQANPDMVIIQGGATGADELARSWASVYGVTTITYPAKWREHGKAAGPIRNQLMIDDGNPDLVIAFPGGRGTADMVRRARKAGIPVHEAARSSQSEDTNPEGAT